MGFQDALANVCAPLSIKIDIDPAAMVPGAQMPLQGGSMVDRDHKYCEGPGTIDDVIKEIMKMAGMCKPEACPPDSGDKPSGKPSFDNKPDTGDDDDKGNPFAKGARK